MIGGQFCRKCSLRVRKVYCLLNLSLSLFLQLCIRAQEATFSTFGRAGKNRRAIPRKGQMIEKQARGAAGAYTGPAAQTLVVHHGR